MSRLNKYSLRALRPRVGQTMVMFAIMITVLIGFVSLAIDLGFTYSQRRFTQNAADAGAVAGARLLANSVYAPPSATSCTAGSCSFTVTQKDVWDVVVKYVDENKGMNVGTANYKSPTIIYKDVDKKELAKQTASSTAAVPPTTAMVQVQRQMSFGTFLAPVIGRNTMSVGAQATAQIMPVAKPQYPPGPTWPMTRADNDNQGVDKSPPANCPPRTLFWTGSPSSGTGTTADWKQLIYYGRKSAYVNLANLVTTQAPAHDQLLTEFDASFDPYSLAPPADLKGNDVQIALETWFRNGFKGKINASPNYSPPPTDANLEPGSWQQGVHGDKAEVISGNLGSNMSQAMKDFITNNPSGTDSCGGTFAIVYMYMWRADTAESWVSNQTPRRFQNPNQGQAIERVTFTRWQPFKFYNTATSFPNASEIWGYYTSTEVGNASPTSGPPSPDANLVSIVE